MGELCISPIGYAMVGRLVPRKLQSMMMGVWMMTSGIAGIGSSYISNDAVSSQNLTHPLLSNPSFAHTFNYVGYGSIVAGIILVALIPWLNRMIEAKPATLATN